MESEMSLARLEKCKLSRTGATFEGGMDFATWARQGRELATIASGMNFWIGDWLNFGMLSFCRRAEAGGKFVASDAYKEALKSTGLEHETLRNLAWVSSAVSPAARSGRLSWAHHREVAVFPGTKQRHWLRLAEAGDSGEVWSVSQLRIAIRKAGQAIDDGDEGDLPMMLWAKPAGDLYRLLKQECNEVPIEQWTAERKEAVRVALKEVKEIIDQLWS